MIKFILIVSFLLVTVASFFGWLDIGFDSFNEANTILEQKELKDKIKVPTGMEKEYEAVLARNVEIKKEQIINNQTTAPAKAQMSDKEAKEQALAFLNNEPAQVKEQVKNKEVQKPVSAQTTKQKQQITSNDKLLIKPTSFFVQNNNLIVSMKIHNPKQTNFNDVVTIVCSARNNSGKPIDAFSWSGKLNIPSKKTILLQEANLGYINVSEEVNLSCKVE